LQSLRQRVLKHGLGTSALISTIDTQLLKLMQDLTKIRHPNFGCVFKSGTKETLIAYQLLRFADLYTSRVENVLMNPLSKFAPRRRLLAHDISITAAVNF